MKRLSLPLILNRENKIFIGVAWFIIAASLYLSSNHVHFFDPHFLPMSWMDSGIPFIPQTVWIYLSEYVFFYSIYLICKDIVNLNRYIYSFMALQLVSVLIFWLWPTTYPRDAYPLVQDSMDRVTYFVFNSLRQTDSPANCAPSLHVSSVYLSSFLFLKEQKEKFKWFFLWGTLIAISTLTTKQHYVIDVVTGFMMAVGVFWLFIKRVDFYPARQTATTTSTASSD